jgi:hypothetical protein
MAKLSPDHRFQGLFDRLPSEWLTNDSILDGKDFKMVDGQYVHNTHAATFKSYNLNKLNKEENFHWHGIEIQEVTRSWSYDDIKVVPGWIQFVFIWPRLWPSENKSDELRRELMNAFNKWRQEYPNRRISLLSPPSDEVITRLREMGADHSQFPLIYGYRFDLSFDPDTNTLATSLKKLPSLTLYFGLIFPTNIVQNVADWNVIMD